MKAFDAIVDGDRIRWASHDPKFTKPTPVTVSFIEPIELTDGQTLADFIERLVNERGGVTSFGDAATWQREQRDDRQMPGREQ